MWNFSSSIIIITCIIFSCIFNTKVILPRLKYFFLICFFTIIIVGVDFFTLLSKGISEFIFNTVLSCYFIAIMAYLEADNNLRKEPKKKRKRLVPYLTITIFCLILNTVFYGVYYTFVSIKQHEILPCFNAIKKYSPMFFCTFQIGWISIETILKKRKSSILLSLITLSFAVYAYYLFSEKVMGLGVSLTLLFLYSGIEGKTDYYDLNSINLSSNMFNLAYRYKKISKKKAFVFIKINSNVINKRASIDKIFSKNVFKFKKNLFGKFLLLDECKMLSTTPDEFIKFKIDNKAINYTYQIFIINSDLYNQMPFDMSELVNYISTNKNNYEKIHKITKEDIKNISKSKKILEMLNDAVLNDGFEIYYQPIYSTHDKKFTSAEALIRFKNADAFEYISPEIFIPIAENNGLIEQIGNIVFEKVCSFYKNKNLEALGIKYIEFNVSGLHISKENIVEDFQKIIKKYDLNPENLNIEITETAQISNQNIVEENLLKLRKLGFKFSMDDFGSGYSNMSNVVKNNYELIKIDKSIVWGALKNSDTLDDTNVLLNTCIDLGHKLNKKVVAEGVEDKAMAYYLERQGVEYLQGYYYSRPINEAMFVEFVRMNNGITW